MLVLAAAWALMVGAISLWRAPWGLIVLLAGLPLFLVRTSILGIPTTALELAIYTVAIVAVVRLTRTKAWVGALQQIRTTGAPYRWPVMLWLGATFFSAVLSPEWRLSFGIIKGWFFDPLLVVMLLTSLTDTETNLNPKDIVSYGLLGAGSIIAIYGIYDYFWGYTFETGRLDAFYTSPNYAAMFLGPALFISLGLLWQEWRGRHRTIVLVASILIFVAFVLTGSFGGYVAVMVALLAGIILSPLTSHWRTRLILILIIGSMLALVTGAIQLRGHYNNFYRVGSWQIRTELWRVATVLTIERPILGVGLGRFQRELPLLQVTKPWLFTLKPELLQFHLPHSLYLTIAVESGLIALLGFLWFVARWFKRTLTAYGKNRSPALWGAIGAMTAMLIHGLVDTPYFKNDLAVLFWLVLAVTFLVEQGRPSQSSTSF